MLLQGVQGLGEESVICPPSRFALLDTMLDKLLDIKKKGLVTTRQILCSASCTNFKL
jgi:hypothetical protein